jgi:hypothetical protein
MVEKIIDDHRHSFWPSVLSRLNFGIESLQFYSGVVDRELPIDGSLFLIDVR